MFLSSGRISQPRLSRVGFSTQRDRRYLCYDEMILSPRELLSVRAVGAGAEGLEPEDGVSPPPCRLGWVGMEDLPPAFKGRGRAGTAAAPRAGRAPFPRCPRSGWGGRRWNEASTAFRGNQHGAGCFPPLVRRGSLGGDVMPAPASRGGVLASHAQRLLPVSGGRSLRERVRGPAGREGRSLPCGGRRGPSAVLTGRPSSGRVLPAWGCPAAALGPGVRREGVTRSCACRLPVL